MKEKRDIPASFTYKFQFYKLLKTKFVDFIWPNDFVLNTIEFLLKKRFRNHFKVV
ncbi:Uncharacterised protein [Chlamydia trachomatis]|nr:Uncharacterised protein [Chlamydia trachomatis]